MDNGAGSGDWLQVGSDQGTCNHRLGQIREPAITGWVNDGDPQGQEAGTAQVSATCGFPPGLPPGGDLVTL